MLDNSSSMQIGATNSDFAKLQSCASAPADYIEATDLPGVTAAFEALTSLRQYEVHMSDIE